MYILASFFFYLGCPQYAFYQCCGQACVDAMVAATQVDFAQLELPFDLPHRLTPDDARRLYVEHVQLRGHCPVSLRRAMTRQFAGAFRLVRGSEACGVVYNEQVFLMRGEEELAEFMRFPSRYADVVMPLKLAVDAPKVVLSDLLASGKVTGYLEQTVATKLTDALLALDESRLRHPALSIKQTALMQLAIRLKGTPSSA
jgi:hypothetical protein